MQTGKPMTVTLGAAQALVDQRVKSGAYASADEVLRAGLDALDREERALDQILRAKVEAALADPRPSLPADEVFARLARRRAGQKA